MTDGKYFVVTLPSGRRVRVRAWSERAARDFVGRVYGVLAAVRVQEERR